MTERVSTTIGAAWRQARDRFRQIGIDTASLDARLLAQRAFGLDAVGLARGEADPVPEDAQARLDAFVARRLSREPVARILGEKEFYGLDFALSPETLVPRPETELLVDLALAELKGRASPRLLDLGTGTGCIAIAVLANLPDARAVATDLAHGALATARTNAGRHQVADRLDLRGGAWFDPIAENERFDVIVANPPYIAHSAIGSLELDVRGHDPHLALDGGPDGLDAYRTIISDASAHLGPDGRLMVEHGAGQATAIESLLIRGGFPGGARHTDLGGHERVFVAFR